MPNSLDQLKESTVLAVDSSDIALIKKFQPTHVTTNPSIILKATQLPENAFLIKEALSYANQYAKSSIEKKHLFLNQLFVNFGADILKHIPGTISTQLDPRLSFDSKASISHARSIIQMYEDKNFPRNRILIKLAATWEGIQAAKYLEQEGIHCNMTLMFSLVQAVASAEAKVTMIAPYIARATDWYKQNGYSLEKDPGVESTKQIYYYFKKFGFQTQIMGASFRNTAQITELAGCDILTIAPLHLHTLANSLEHIDRKLNPISSQQFLTHPLSFDEKAFRLTLNNHAMATEKLAEGIRKFAEDTRLLEQLINRPLE